MSTSTLAADQAADAYNSLAPFYDEFTAGYAHDAWIAAIDARARALGLRGRRALDLACGTGNSTIPLRARGYDVIACDISEGMVREARRKLPQYADSILVADMRTLPPLGEFDLVVCLDDAINYLLEPEDVQATFENVASRLAPGGLFAFDLNSLSTYRGSFAQALIRESPSSFFAWNGRSDTGLAPGATTSATVEIFTERDDGLWERHSSRHTQRHHPPERVRGWLAAAGLECVEIAGQLPGGRLEADADEQRHIKLVYFARRAGRLAETR